MNSRAEPAVQVAKTGQTDQTEPSGGLYRQVLKATSVMGVSFVLRVLVSLLRMKVIAVFLGPAGIGLLGLYQSVVTSFATVGNLGLNASGVRQVAKTSGDESHLAAIRVALWRSCAALAVITAATLWLLRDFVSASLFGGEAGKWELLCLAVAVGLTILADSRSAYLTGLHRTSALARIGVIQPVVTTVVVVLAILFAESISLLIFVVSVPVARWALVEYHLGTPIRVERVAWKRLWSELQPLLKIGLPLMASALLIPASLMVVNGYLNNTMGMEAVGLYQASWTITYTYIGLMMNGLRVDYIPRITKVAQIPQQANRLISIQLKVALLMLGSVLLAISAFAPDVFRLIYTAEFVDAAPILQFQAIGNLFKVASVPFGFFLIACGASRTFFLIQLAGTAILLLIIFFGLERLGLNVTGAAFVCSQGLMAAMLLMWVKNRSGYKLPSDVGLIFISLLIACAGLFALGQWDPMAARIVGALVTLGFGIYALRSLSKSAEIPSVAAGISDAWRVFSRVALHR